MIDFTPIREKKVTFAQFAQNFTPQELHDATDSVYTHILDQLSVCDDRDVIFQPEDPLANDPYAADPAEQKIAWTLAHVIVHVNASNDESAFLAAEMARGVEFHGRSRYEVPWREVKTIDYLRSLLIQSQRLCLSSLEMWPEPPHFETTYSPWPSLGLIDARGRYMLGLTHTDSHLGQIAEIIRQARIAG